MARNQPAKQPRKSLSERMTGLEYVSAAQPQNERLAVLEERLAAHFESDREMFAALREDISAMRVDGAATRAAVQLLVDSQNKQRGFLAGASFIWTAVWAAVAIGVASAVAWFKS